MPSSPRPRPERTGPGSPTRTADPSRPGRPPLLLLHGVPGDGQTFAAALPCLTDSGPVIAPTLPHFGAGAPGTAPFGTDGMAEDILRLAAGLGAGPVDIAAWSFSAHAALAAALRQPQRIRRLFLYEPGFPTYVTDPSVRAEIDADAQAAFGPVYHAAMTGTAEQATAALLDASAGEPGYFDRQPDSCRQTHLRTAASVLLLFRQTPPVNLRAEDLARLSCPVTVCWGQRSRPCYRLTAQAAAAAIPQAVGLEIAGATHLWPEQDPAAFAATLRHWRRNGSAG